MVAILAWVGVIGLVYAAYGPTLRALLEALVLRIRSGGAVEFLNVKLPEIRITSSGVAGSAISSKPDPGSFLAFRDATYAANEYIFLAHRLFPSQEATQLYDILIYLVPHTDRGGSLNSVDHVEYFFGPSWGNNVFQAHDRGKRFGIVVSAYGKGFLCVAKIHFDNGRPPVETWRYIDFEMGMLGSA